MKWLLGVFAAFALAIGGCAGEGKLQTIDQTRKAGTYIKNHPDAPPDVQRAGADVEANAGLLQKDEGVPDAPVEYSPEASQQARDQYTEELSRPPFILTFLAEAAGSIGWDWAGTALLGAWGLFEGFRRRKTQKKLVATYHGVEKVKEAVKTNGITDPAAINSILGSVATAYNVYTDVHAEVKKLKDKGTIPNKA